MAFPPASGHRLVAYPPPPSLGGAAHGYAAVLRFTPDCPASRTLLLHPVCLVLGCGQLARSTRLSGGYLDGVRKVRRQLVGQAL